MIAAVSQQQLVAAAPRLGSESHTTQRDVERRISGCSPTQESLAQWPVPMQPPRRFRARAKPHGASATKDLPTGGMRYARYSVKFQRLAEVSQASGCRKAPPHCRLAKKDVNAKPSFLRLGPSPRHIVQRFLYRGMWQYSFARFIGRQTVAAIALTQSYLEIT